ncbi:transketolase [Rhodospirillaceae bacterium KN72]|uniref:Transketolase n=1 Tax=Pacificispira spongiicola TaxID=2729598 RepID=A0A7Y0HHA0_9PROT|nr:transketolase [Pacificispira spongiicola]NMM45697.1 transketolase [Pacificispira spongiicola]
MTRPIPHVEMANAIRALSMDAVEAAQSGHPGMPMGMADVATVLFTRFLKFDASAPEWHDRDRFVLSAGHGSMLLYSLLHLCGYPGWDMDVLRSFRQLGSPAAGHPEYGHGAGIETTTGPLGQGLAAAVGMALGEERDRARFGSDLVDHYTYVVTGDGCLMEGISHEAISFAGHHRLSRLIVLFDDNHVSIDGDTALTCSDDQAARFKACGWHCQSVDGHDPEAVAAAIGAARDSDRPSMIACRTIIGYGAPSKAGTAKVHGAPLGPEEIEAARAALVWPHAPFTVPDTILNAWRAAGSRGKSERAAWIDRFNAAPSQARADFTAYYDRDLSAGWKAALTAHIAQESRTAPSKATRKASGDALEVLTPLLPALVGGSADLTGSVNTRTNATETMQSGIMENRYIHYGIREHAMAAIMNGLALHGGTIPYGGTFLVFAGYMHPAMRLSALMGLQVIYILTHDSIGLGEDGPTHQPVETLAMLRATPNLTVIRPADTVETSEAWAIALKRKDGPTAIVLSRQNLPCLRTKSTGDGSAADGGYILREAACAPRTVTLIATGSETSIAVAARDALEPRGIGTAVVSLPSWELFDAQNDDYRRRVLGTGLRVGIEAAGSLGWHKYLGEDGIFIGMQGFGASGPAEELYRHFGITADAIVDAVVSHPKTQGQTQHEHEQV